MEPALAEKLWPLIRSAYNKDLTADEVCAVRSTWSDLLREAGCAFGLLYRHPPSSAVRRSYVPLAGRELWCDGSDAEPLQFCGFWHGVISRSAEFARWGNYPIERRIEELQSPEFDWVARWRLRALEALFNRESWAYDLLPELKKVIFEYVRGSWGV
jgi:hypothetical protein